MDCSSRYCRGSACAYFLQRASVGARTFHFSVNPVTNVAGTGISTRCPFDCAFRLCLRSRLTPVRLTLTGKPWSFGARVSHPRYRYLCLHLLFRALRLSSRTTFGTRGMLPYRFQTYCLKSRGFGGAFEARLSSAHDRSTGELLRTL